MFHRSIRAANATARPVKINGVAATNVSASASRFANAASHIVR
jgi:hypothetical protein